MKKIGQILIPLLFWIGLWEAASLLVPENLRLFLPGPVAVIRCLFRLIPTAGYWSATGATLLRILLGFGIGAILGILLGILTDGFPLVDILFSPALRVIRAVPVVCFIILAYLFLPVDRLPIFIASLMVVPLIWQSVHDGLAATDRRLIEMGQVYGLSRGSILRHIKLPKNKGVILTACVNGLGFAWKSGVAAEVLCTPGISLGHSVFRAKAALNFDEVYALTLTTVLLSLLIEWLFKGLCRRYLEKKEASAHAEA